MTTSWAALLGSNLPTRNDNNVMEIVLEKDEKGVFNASDEEVAKALHKLGADLRPGVHLTQVQICPMGRNAEASFEYALRKNYACEHLPPKVRLAVRFGL